MRSKVFLGMLALAGALGTGCADQNTISFFIAGHALSESEGEGAGARCMYSGESALALRGTLDVGLICAGTSVETVPPRQYVLHPMYVNQIINRESSTPHADPNGVFVQGAEVELRATDGSALAVGLPNPFTVTASDYVPSAGGTAESRSVGSLEIVPPLYGEALAAMGGNFTIVAAVTAFGQTNGEVDVESGEFLWPIDVCQGCLFIELPPTDEGGVDSLPCEAGQDDAATVFCAP